MNEAPTPPLHAHFQDFFHVCLATTPELLNQVYGIRYDVYCREFHYETEESCPGGLEQDDYDPHSLHVLIVHKSSNVGAGCVRMVRPPKDDPAFQLPMERYCDHTLNHPERHPQRMPRYSLGEISRLAVHTSFRRRPGESESPFGAVQVEMGAQERRTFPLVSLALFAGATAISMLAGRPHMFVMIEPRLARRLQSLGFPFTQVGEPMDYHGLRAAYHVTVEECLQSWGDDMLMMYGSIHETLQTRATQEGFSFT